MAKPSLASEVPGFDTERYDTVDLLPGSPEIDMLEHLYAPLRFRAVTVYLQPPWRLLQPGQQDADIVSFWVSVRGPFGELVRHRFAHHSWEQVPPCGITSHRTEGFGRARVKRNKNGEYSMSSMDLDHALDLLAPLSAMWWRPAQSHR